MESSNGVQLRKLCSHILGPMASEEALSAQCRAALMILSSSSSGQENVRDNEFVVAEKIKKQLVCFLSILIYVPIFPIIKPQIYFVKFICLCRYEMVGSVILWHLQSSI